MMREYRFIIAVLLVLAVCVTVLETLSTAGGRLSPIDEGLLFIFSPFQRFFGGIQYFFSSVSNTIEAERENKDLKIQIQILKEELARLQSVKVENKQLQNLLDFKATFHPKTISARIIGRDPSNWFDTMTLSKGLLDGVLPNEGVVGSGYAVGKILDVSSHFSHVLLLTSPRVAIPVEVLPSGAQGIAYGREEEGGVVKYLPLDANIKPGDEVITSGLGHIFPQKGIPVGSITSVQLDPETSFFKEADFRPFLNSTSLQEVLILQP
jgi:rod shape-determining protein MreC